VFVLVVVVIIITIGGVVSEVVVLNELLWALE
jgi:uncharacterized membrane protein YciS (DUF1049 family)